MKSFVLIILAIFIISCTIPVETSEDTNEDQNIDVNQEIDESDTTKENNPKIEQETIPSFPEEEEIEEIEDEVNEPEEKIEVKEEDEKKDKELKDPKKDVTCEDPDGLDYYNKGTVHVEQIGGDLVYNQVDDCLTDTIVRERTCTPDAILAVGIESYDCAKDGTKCVDGACVKKSETCQDASDCGSPKKEYYCKDIRTLMVKEYEYYCDSNNKCKEVFEVKEDGDCQYSCIDDKCSDEKIATCYEDSDCGEEFIDSFCDYDGTLYVHKKGYECVFPGTEGAGCNFGTIEVISEEFCEYGCIEEECLTEPTPEYFDSCTNTDDGLDFLNKGTTLIKDYQGNVKKTGYDRCTNNQMLLEYYCEENSWGNPQLASTTTDCSEDNRYCIDGACVDP